MSILSIIVIYANSKPDALTSVELYLYNYYNKILKLFNRYTIKPRKITDKSPTIES